MKRSILVSLLLTPLALRMADGEAAAIGDVPGTAAADPVAPDTAAAATVAIDVPAEHADLLQRAVELLKKGEQWVVDNVEAGVTTLEKMFANPDVMYATGD